MTKVVLYSLREGPSPPPEYLCSVLAAPLWRHSGRTKHHPMSSSFAPVFLHDVTSCDHRVHTDWQANLGSHTPSLTILYSVVSLVP